MTDERDNSKEFTLNHLDELENEQASVDDGPLADTAIDTSPPAIKPGELFHNDHHAEALTEPTAQPRKEPVIRTDSPRESDEDNITARDTDTTPLFVPAASESATSNPFADSDPQDSVVTESKRPSILAIVAIILSSIAILLQLTTSTPNDSTAAIEEQAALNEELYREMKLELEMLTKKLESQQSYLRDSLQAQINRINAEPVKVATASVSPVKVKKPTPITPAIAEKPTGWAVNLLSVDDKAAAIKEKERYNSLGITAEIATLYINKTVKYRIRVSGFESKGQATNYKKRLAAEYGINDAWVYKP